MNLTKYVACICEGAAEKAIMEILLDADKLIFKRDDLLEGELLRCRSGKNFEEQHLRKGFTEKITVLRILTFLSRFIAVQILIANSLDKRLKKRYNTTTLMG